MNLSYSDFISNFPDDEKATTDVENDNNKLPDRNLSIIYDISPFKADNSIILTITRLSEDKEDIVSQKKYFH